jgi:hypothetical protein
MLRSIAEAEAFLVRYEGFLETIPLMEELEILNKSFEDWWDEWNELLGKMVQFE